MDKTVAKQTWGVLAKAIDEIYNRNASLLSFEELYRNAYNLVLHKHGTLLYEGVTEKLYSHLTETAKNLSNVPNTSLLEELSSTWVEHQVRPQQMKSRRKRGTVTAAQIDGHNMCFWCSRHPVIVSDIATPFALSHRVFTTCLHFLSSGS